MPSPEPAREMPALARHGPEEETCLGLGRDGGVDKLWPEPAKGKPPLLYYSPPSGHSFW